MTEVKGKHITVAGAARSGAAVAVLLLGKGAEIFVTDNGSISEPVKARLQQHQITFEENGHTQKAMQADFLVVSPGVPTESDIIQYYLKKNKKVYSELEAASWFCKSDIVAITGTNGKTTTTSWIDHVWKTAGKKHLTAGNIGLALSDVVEQASPGTDVILEVSSFQLDHIDQFRPKVSVILNITPDHLNRYQYKFENYIRSKTRIFENQKKHDVLIYSEDDPVLSKAVNDFLDKEYGPQTWTFSVEKEVETGAFVRNNQIILKTNNHEEVLMNTEEVVLNGRHNLNNGLATALAARAFEIKNDIIRDSLMKFEGVEHRLEFVRELDGVRYINDSKATNVNAVWYALDSFKVPMVVIMGGRDKGNDYSELFSQIREKVHTIIAIGEGTEQIKKQLTDVAPNLVTAGNMEEAVRTARKVAKRGEVVLLSPACASFDMFQNYEHRGKEFKKFVNNL